MDSTKPELTEAKTGRSFTPDQLRVMRKTQDQPEKMDSPPEKDN